MKKHATLSAILSLLLLLPSLAACGGETPPVTADTTAAPAVADTTVPETTEAPVTEYPAPQIEAVKYGGEFRILSNEPRADMFPYSEIYYAEDTGDVINDALFKRNNQIMEKYDVTIVNTDISTGSGKRTFTNAINAGNDDFHIAVIRISDIVNLAQNGYLANIASLPHIDPDAPWYYQQLRDSLTIRGEDYMLIGYLNMRVFDTAGALFYNKDIVEKHNMPDIEQMVFDGTWTLDRFYELCSQVGGDLDQDGKITENDEVGLTSHPGNLLNYFIGAGGEFVVKNSDDIPVYIGINQKNEAILSKVLNIMFTEPAVLHQDSSLYKDYTGAFNADRSLFLSNGIYRIRTLAAVDSAFGVLPLPKWDEAQEKYYVHIGSSLGTAIGIPFNTNTTEMTCSIVEDMMHLSYKYIYPAHIEKTMQLRYASDENSTKIIKILFDSLSIELASALSLDCDKLLRNLGATRSTNIVSTYLASEEKNKAAIETYVAAFDSKQ